MSATMSITNASALPPAPPVTGSIQVKVIELDPRRAYKDTEVRALLGGIARTTLWAIRSKGLLKSSRLYSGGPRRTTPQQILDYIAYLNSVEEGTEQKPVRARR